ncbi:hypothetical protein ACM41_22005 [Bradyrhizobium sp. CCBAU 21362]|uniref:hypothetical protein n=1 Tax=Bradyrhizobium sp. CCBAU 21362 TaxID=1325082 RepID=UPI002304FACC|nr:hypothetical protein [Bradyrhizobium sp. CCBAU 21362]MDA9538789.1 hypothetical protein [Bradyrhizobium sp. CCBAU 21362]
MASVPRYIVERGSDQVRIAFGGIVKIVKDLKITRVTLVVPKKGGWEHTIVARFLGAGVAKALVKGEPVTVVEGVTMVLESSQTLRSSFDQGLLVGAHISVKDMAKLDDAWGAQAIMFLPWVDSEAQEWKDTWRPQTIGAKGEEAQPSSLSEPVEEALRQLTGMINLSTGLSHPLDKQHEQRTFEKLRSKGHAYDPAEIRRWAQRNNWSSSAAADLEAVARKRR